MKTREQFLLQLQQTAMVLPDLTWKIEEILQVGNRFVVRGRATVMPATGRKSQLQDWIANEIAVYHARLCVANSG